MTFLKAMLKTIDINFQFFFYQNEYLLVETNIFIALSSKIVQLSFDLTKTHVDVHSLESPKWFQ